MDAVLINTHVARIEVQSDQLVIELTNAKGSGSKRSRSRNMLKVPWHKTPLKRRREILVPASVLPQDARAMRSENYLRRRRARTAAEFTAQPDRRADHLLDDHC